MKQSFHFTGKSGKVFGCSFRKGRNGQFFGRVTIYPTKKDYEVLSLDTSWQEWRNIPLQKDNPIETGIELKEYCINELEK